MRKVTLCLALAAMMMTCLPANAEKKKDKAEKDTVQVPFIHGIAVHADLVGLIQMAYSDHGQYEAGLRINLKDRFFPAFELGYGKGDETEDYVDESWFKAKAPYFRIGCDFNILRDKHDIYKLFAGVRYAYTNFNYDMTVLEAFETDATEIAAAGEIEGEEETEVATTTYEYVEYDGLKARYHWLEALIGVDAKVFGPLHLGWDIRYRRVITKKFDEAGAPWYIPGFGDRKRAGFTMNFNLTLSF